MAIDTPAKIAIIGAGPIGLEAALYARFLGYDVEIFERGRLCENLRLSADDPLHGPFAEHRSTLGLAALSAQDSAWRPPADDAKLTCGEWIELYLAPLAASDLLADELRLRTHVLGVRREDSSPETDDDDEITSPPFELTLRDSAGVTSTVQADSVLDCSGVADLPMPAREIAEGTTEWRPFVTFQPDLYLVGSKSYGAKPGFSFAAGLRQIRDLFALIYDRPDLDIYKRMAGGRQA